MPFNGSGTFNRIYSWITDAANNLNVDATRMDTDTNDIATGLSNCITKDGQQTVTANIPMASFKFTGLGNGSAASDSANFGQVIGYAPHLCEGRLTLSSGTPVPVTNVNAAGTLYFTPYRGNKIALFDGSNWLVRTFTELSIAYPAAAPGVNYDVFCYDNSGTPTLELTAWTNDTTRATALTKQDGVYVKTGAVTRRYLGTIRADSSSLGNDSLTIRHVWNYYNRVPRLMFVTDATGSWNYTLATPRQADANTANQFDVVIGVSEDDLRVETCAVVSNSAGGTNTVATGFGIDSTSTFSTSGFSGATFRSVPTASATYVFFSMGRFYLSAGRHFIAWLEASSAGGTTTWTGGTSSGMQGEVLA